jgi:hypothetical protein
VKKHFLALVLAAHVTRAYAADKSPLDYSLGQYTLLLSMAVFGGLVSWFAKVKSGSVQAWNVMHLIGELVTSAFAGLMAFYICEWAGTAQLVTICMVGVSGHMGARAIAAFEEIARRKLGVEGEKQ